MSFLSLVFISSSLCAATTGSSAALFEPIIADEISLLRDTVQAEQSMPEYYTDVTNVAKAYRFGRAVGNPKPACCGAAPAFANPFPWRYGSDSSSYYPTASFPAASALLNAAAAPAAATSFPVASALLNSAVGPAGPSFYGRRLPVPSVSAVAPAFGDFTEYPVPPAPAALSALRRASLLAQQDQSFPGPFPAFGEDPTFNYQVCCYTANPIVPPRPLVPVCYDLPTVRVADDTILNCNACTLRRY